MATSISLPRAQSTNPLAGLVQLVPGICLLAAIGYAGKILERNLNIYAKSHHWIFPNIECSSCAYVCSDPLGARGGPFGAVAAATFGENSSHGSPLNWSRRGRRNALEDR